MSDRIYSVSFRFGLLAVSVEQCTRLVDNKSDVTNQVKAKAAISFQRTTGDDGNSGYQDMRGNEKNPSNRNESVVVPRIPTFENSEQILDFLNGYDCTNISEISVKSQEDATEKEIQILVEFLRVVYCFVHVEKLSLHSCNIGTDAGASLGDLVKTVKSTICELDLSDNKSLKSSGLESVIAVLLSNSEDCTTLVSNSSTLLMENFEIDQFERSNRYQLCKLDLSNTGLIGSKAGKMIASLLRNNSTILELVLANNRLGNTGIKHLASAFVDNQTLTKLDVSCNNVSDLGIGALMDGFFFHCDDETIRSSIIDLDLSGNTFNSAGTSRMKDALLERKLRNISILNLNSNPPSFDSVHDYALLLQFSYTILELNLSNNNLQDTIIEIVNALHKNRETALKKLDISCNNIRDSACRPIANMIQGNTTLACLNVSKNKITEHGAAELMKALFENTSLIDLNISGNRIQNLRTLSSSFTTMNSS